MYANGNAIRIRVNRGLVAGIFVGLIIAASFAFLTAHQDRLTFSSLTPNTLGGNNPAASGRDPLLWPFSRDSIWNLPIGSNARYVWAGIHHATSMAYFTDADILVLQPSAPATTVYANYDDWGAGTRCSAQGGALFTAPIPADFVVPGSHQGSPDGDTPNAAAAILAADGHTIIQTQPFARCAGQSPTSHYMFGSEDLYGTGETGSHGGSGLSALGGTVRLGELVPGGTIRHSLKLNIDSANFYPGLGGYRWPASKSDAGVGANGWARDLDKIFTNLYVVDNWDKATWQTVSVSNGNVGVGLGTPRVGWAPEFGQVPPPPPPPPPPSPPPALTGTTITLTTSKSPSEINETVAVSGPLTDASGSPVAGRVVSLGWPAEQITWYPEGQIGQFSAADTNGARSEEHTSELQ